MPNLGKRLRIFAVLLLASALLFAASSHEVSHAGAQPSGLPISDVYLAPVRNPAVGTNQPLTVNVDLNLSSGESISSFDVRINYTSYHTSYVTGVLNARSIDYSNNLFANNGQTQVLVVCIDGLVVQGQSSGCTSDNVGQVHLTEALLGRSEITGPKSALQLFSITFNVTGLGSSRFYVDEANLVNPYADPSNPTQLNTQFIPILKFGGVFGNTGVVAFFNFKPSDTLISPSILPNNAASFDASGSFNPTNASDLIKTYSWNFGDQSGVDNKVVPADSHTFAAPGNYTVSLTITDLMGKTNQTTRIVPVAPALGSLSLTVDDQSGTPLSGIGQVELFNSSSSSTPFATKTVNIAGGATFTDLIPQNYTLTFSGSGYISTSKTEKIIPGYTTMDTIYLNLAPTPQNFSGLIYAAAIVAATGAFAFAILYQRRRQRKKQAKGSSSGRARSRSS